MGSGRKVKKKKKNNNNKVKSLGAVGKSQKLRHIQAICYGINRLHFLLLFLLFHHLSS